MATTQQPKTVAEEQTERTIEDGRLERALTQDMDATPVAPGMFDIAHDDETYTVDVEGGSCQCKDYEFRGDALVCKHAIKACIRHAFVAEKNTRLVARVLRAVREVGCPHDVDGCSGPTKLGDRGYPCPDCVTASSAGDWVVWTRLVAKQTPPGAPRAMTDGGRR